MDKRGRPIRRWLIVFTLLLGPGVAAAEDQAEMREACAKQLTALGEVCLMYMGQNESQPPPRLSELYYQAYTFELDAFVCPGKPVDIRGRDEIDDKAGYILSPAASRGQDAPRPLLQDRSPANHGGQGINVFYSDGTVRWLPAKDIPSPSKVPVKVPQAPPRARAPIPAKTPPATSAVRSPIPIPTPSPEQKVAPSRQAAEAPKVTVKTDAKGWMGLKIQTMTRELARYLRIEPAVGVRIDAVLRGGPGHVARLRPGDIVTYLDGTPVDKAEELADLISRLLPGQLIDVDVLRNYEPMSIRAVVGRQPASDMAMPQQDASRAEQEYTPTGRWRWHVNDQYWGDVVFENDEVTGYDMQDRQTNHGKWIRVSNEKNTIQIRWNKGRWVDTLKFSADGETLAGKNNANARLRAEKIP